MAWTAPKTWAVGDILTSSDMDTHVRDNLRFLKGLDGDIYLEDDLGVGIATPQGDITAASYGRTIAVDSANSNEIIAMVARGHRSGSDTGIGHFVVINRAATG